MLKVKFSYKFYCFKLAGMNNNEWFFAPLLPPIPPLWSHCLFDCVLLTKAYFLHLLTTSQQFHDFLYVRQLSFDNSRPVLTKWIWGFIKQSLPISTVVDFSIFFGLFSLLHYRIDVACFFLFYEWICVSIQFPLTFTVQKHQMNYITLRIDIKEGSLVYIIF